jgi:hypothetical protein
MKEILAIFSTLLLTSSASDYCSFCPNHIACNNNGQFSFYCPRDAHMLKFSKMEIDTLIVAHNTARNKIAGGREFGFSMASQMMAMVS